VSKGERVSGGSTILAVVPDTAEMSGSVARAMGA